MRRAEPGGRRTLIISAAVHVAAIVLIVGQSTRTSREPSLYSEATANAAQGVGGGFGLGLPEAPTLTQAEAAQYAGRYAISTQGQPNVELIISAVYEAGYDRWSLLLHEGRAFPYKIIPFARDSFAHRLHRDRRISFTRGDTSITAVELSADGQSRRGVRISGR
jgi:hypothetical protein